MKQLPKEFVEEMRELLGEEELGEFLSAFDETCPTSIRWNRALVGERMLENPVPWCAAGEYLDARPSFTLDPLFHAGAYYVQEASSMFVDHLVRLYVGNRAVNALDLCAAPGGKSTLLLSALSTDSLLVANEIMPKRAQILRENIAKWGAKNVVVSNNKSSDFRHFAETFDLILCDAPCSGEGMFRKDDTAIDEWSPENVEMCWRRQREIVENIWPALKPGGLFIYSTCTFNTKENEENVRWIRDELGAEILPCEAKAEWGVKGNLLADETFDCCHFMPHRVKGEGFFCAILRKDGEGDERKAGKDDERKTAITPKMLKSLNLLPLPEAEKSVATVEVDRQTALQYLHGEALRLSADVPRGLVTIAYEGLPLGQVKNIGTRANNLYPKEWRIRKQLT